MKNLTSVLVVLGISFATLASDWPFDRLDRLYNSDPTRCLKISKRYIKHLPENPVPYYFASMVYRDKSKTHSEIKTRYMMMSKSIGYAMKFENFEDLDLAIKLDWEAYIEELKTATASLVDEMEETELANLGDRLASKHQKMVDQREEILLASIGSNNDPFVVIPPNAPTSEDETEESSPVTESSQEKGYFGLATGKEDVPSFNKLQERELLNLINEERKALFMTSLKWEDDLGRAARYHAADMATQDYFFEDSYDIVDGVLVRVADATSRNGQFYPEKNLKSQNIASGRLNAQEVLKQWMSYDKQYDVLFDESIKKIGIGLCYDASSVYGYYWVLITAKK